MKKKIRFTLLLAAMAAASEIAVGADAFDLKGLSLGESIEGIRAAFPGIHCGDNGDDFSECIYTRVTVEIPGYPKIEALETLGGSTATMWDLRTFRGKLGKAEVLMWPQDYEQVSGALIEKFGKPTSRQTSVIRTKIGTPYAQEELTWRRPGGQILKLWKYASSVDTMDLVLVSSEYLAAEQALERKKHKKGAKDL